MTKLKGKKYYGVANGEGDIKSSLYDLMSAARDRLDKQWPYLVEFTITRVYTRATDLVEIENDIENP